MLIPRPYQQDAYDASIKHIRTNKDPSIVHASTAAGKSIIVAMLAQTVKQANKRTLILVPNGDLAEQNANKFREIGEKPSIYSASLGHKCVENHAVFATPMSVLNNLDDFGDEYALIISDECQMISENPDSSSQKILTHFRSINPKIRILGLTATPVRFKTKLVSAGSTFKSVCYSITSEQLSSQGWTVPYSIGVSDSTYSLLALKTDSKGKFKQSEVDALTLDNERLTRQIIDDLVGIMDLQNRKCCIIFASSIKHAEEIRSYLPESDSSILITGKTSKKERARLLQEARDGKHRYIINYGTLTTGTDIPIIDCVALLRASESVGLVIQMLGRGCRLYAPSWLKSYGQTNRLSDFYEGKMDCLVLDFGENLERFALSDDLVISGLLDLKERKDKQGDVQLCPECNAENSLMAQRCHGVVNDGTRCEYRFLSKTCDACDSINSLSARHCTDCGAELIDPNDKLERKAATDTTTPRELPVVAMRLRKHEKQGRFTLRIDWTMDEGTSILPVAQFLSENRVLYFLKKCQAQHLMTCSIDEIVDRQHELVRLPEVVVRRPKGSKYFNVTY
jgi:DNA repair protein RadD